MKRRLFSVFTAFMFIAASVNMFSVNSTSAEDVNPVVTEIPGTDRTESDINKSFLSVSGFAKGHITDRSQYKEGDKEYAVVTNEKEFLSALKGAQAGMIKVIEVRNDLYLGWNELSVSDKDVGGSLITQYTGTSGLAETPVANPTLIESGISALTLTNINGLTIFSTSGATIRHAEIKLNSSVNDLAIRNLNFTDVWEWDDWRTSGFGSTGGHGTSKRTGFTYVKVNGASNVWIDHCNFGIAFDGNVDIENGSNGVSITWCKFGDTDFTTGSMLNRAIDYFEDIYQDSKTNKNISSFKMYGIARDNDLSKEQIANYMGYHKKCHLMGAGDKDTWIYKDTDGSLKINKDKKDANEYIRVSLGYNNYTNMGSRLPLLRGGVCHLYNCYFDNSAILQASEDYSKKNPDGLTVKEQIDKAGGATHFLSRGMNPRNGAVAAADTCDFYCMSSPLFYAEKDAYKGDFEGWFGYNYGLIVNSKVQNDKKSTVYTGSSWDNGGSNPFAKDVTYETGKPTVGVDNWSWGQEGDRLSYSYKTFPLDKVKDYTSIYGGCGTVNMSSSDWLKVEYDENNTIDLVDKSIEVPVENVSLNYDTRTVYLGEYLQLYEKLTPINNTETGEDFTWSSSDTSVATVSAAGLVKPLKEGRTEITFKSKEGKTAKCDVTVESLPDSVQIVSAPSSLYVGDIVKLSASVLPETVTNKNVAWDALSSGIKVLDSENGIIQISDLGGADSKTVRVQALSLMKGNRLTDKEIKKSVSIKANAVPVAVTAIYASDTSIILDKGQNATLDATVVPADATNKKIYYTTENTDIVSVDENGCITALDYGEATVTAVTMNYGFKADYSVKVQKAEEKDPPVVSPPSVFLAGDVTSDGKVDLNDARLVLKIAVGIEVKETISEQGMLNADYDKNGNVDLNDATYTLKSAVGIKFVIP